MIMRTLIELSFLSNKSSMIPSFTLTFYQLNSEIYSIKPLKYNSYFVLGILGIDGAFGACDSSIGTETGIFGTIALSTTEAFFA